MIIQPSPSFSGGKQLSEALDIINDLAQKSSAGGYIYRGETRFDNRYVSSSLHRHISGQYPDAVSGWHNIDAVQEEFLEAAKKFTVDRDCYEILATLRHNGGVVNVVDFTTDYNVALFFACDGPASDGGEDGRIIMLEKEAFETFEPGSPANRVIAQKSIFVVPPGGSGVIEPSAIAAIVRVPAHLKPTILGYLDASHNIRVETIYNDLLGFIHLQDRYTSPVAEFLAASKSENTGDLEKAVERYSNIIGVAPWDIVARYHRARCYLQLGEYSDAVADFTVAIDKRDAMPNPWRALAYNYRGLAELRMGEIGKAGKDLCRARELIPKDISSIVDISLGILSLTQSDWDTAESLFRSAESKGDFEGFGFSEDYGSIEDFNRKYGVVIPRYIAEILNSPAV